MEEDNIRGIKQTGTDFVCEKKNIKVTIYEIIFYISF